MWFRDRLDAGRQLARALHAWRGRHPLVLAIPRGAVPMGRVVADALGGDLDVVLARKLGAPGNPEYAIGAIDEDGWVARNPDVPDTPEMERHIAAQRELELAQIRRRRALYTPGRGPASPLGRITIVVDDGLATGSTMIAALHSLRRHAPTRLICAVPVAPPETLRRIGLWADEVVCLSSPASFHAVGQFYRDFTQVEDADVVTALSGPRLPAGNLRIDLADVTLQGELEPGDSQRLVIFAHGSGSSRLSPRNREVARVLNEAGMGTLLFDMLTTDEDRQYERRFDIPLLTERLLNTSAWLRARGPWRSVGYFGASTGAAAALRAAARHPVDAVVSRGGRPDLAGAEALRQVECPVLLLVGDRDVEVLALNQRAQEHIGPNAWLKTIAGATHLFEEEGALEQVAALARDWFERHLERADARPA